MSEDATLDEFVENAVESPADDETPTDEEVDEGGPDGSEVDGLASGGTEAADDRSTVGTGERFGATVRWTPDGAACASCGATVERRWTDGTDGDAAFVCADCKEW
ncbi:MAG: hypothetical protein V5A33_01445 [Halobacteriales archaeon]